MLMHVLAPIPHQKLPGLDAAGHDLPRRECLVPNCETLLCRYDPGPHCFTHAGPEDENSPETARPGQWDKAMNQPSLRSEPMTPRPFPIDRSKVTVESYPGAANDMEARVQAAGGRICEQHPDKQWPHDDCLGPGMLRKPYEEWKASQESQAVQEGSDG
jgi:hypothetical protein